MCGVSAAADAVVHIATPDADECPPLTGAPRWTDRARGRARIAQFFKKLLMEIFSSHRCVSYRYR